jgi:hypothetical protein
MNMKHIHTFENFLNEDVRWQDVQVGDSANVKAENRTGIVMSSYGKKFNIKFADGSLKTYDAAQLTFIVEEGEHPYYKGISKSTEDKKKAQMADQAAADDDDPEAYKELPGDKKGKKLLKTSKHTKSYHELYGEK